jgi:DNA-binding NarL/FixJ family response regulator
VSATESLRIVLADDHIPTRAGVREALEADGMTICAEAGNAADAVQAAIEHHPDICVLDVRMPGDGITAASEIAEKLPDIAIVMLSAHSENSDVFAALRAGARGFLLKDTNPARLPHALRGVLSGEAAIPRPLVMRLVNEFRTRERRRNLSQIKPGVEGLSEREWEVLEKMRDGLTTKQIAQILGISEVTVRRHISTILHKFHVKDRAGALAFLESLESSS